MESLYISAARRNMIFEVNEFIKTFLLLFCLSIFWYRLNERCVTLIMQNQSRQNQLFLLYIFSAFELPQLPPSPCKTCRLWTFCIAEENHCFASSKEYKCCNN